ncbi:MAG: DUF308 domain-containing protein [Xanthobacteraceae bacterium]|nr:DUF308 domain-containing protein [Xanthobacteraceae bacterium]
MLGLLVAGLVIGVAGLLSIVFAIPMKEFSLGNTLIVSGVTGVCTGAVLVAATMLLRELKVISRALREGGLPAAASGRDAMLHPGSGTAAAAPGLSAQAGEDEGEAPLPPAWQADAAAVQTGAPEPDQVATAAPAKKRRNLLFMSTRRDRSPGPAGTAEDNAAAAAPDEAPAPPSASFEDAWPLAERNRSEPARHSSLPPRPAEAGAARTSPSPPVRRSAETSQVTVLKSGVVDGMAYSLYSDGSIEAQLPEGMIRFASIDELRHHLDQRG